MHLIKNAASLLLFLFLTTYCEASAHAQKTVCLNMIVKNESNVIQRCLTSVLPIINYWVIVDTGSTDGTQKVITELMNKNQIPGELHERPWVNFAHNRNEALKLAHGKSDYICFIDADEYLAYESNFKLPELDKDFYYITIVQGLVKYKRIGMIKDQPEWEWKGVLHETLCPKTSYTYDTLAKVVKSPTVGGARDRDPKKYEKDVQVLETALKDEPNNSRYVFYLANSHRDAGNHAEALKNYLRRATMGGWDEELYSTLLQIAIMQEKLNRPTREVTEAYLRAFSFRPSRAEPLFYLANYYRKAKEFEKGFQVSKVAMTIPIPNEILFVEYWAYNYGIPLEYSICAYWTERYEECIKTSTDILQKNDIPENVRETVQRNLGFAREKIIEKINQSTH